MAKGDKRSIMSRLPIPQRVDDALDAALDQALRVQRPVVLAYLNRVRRKHPQTTPDEFVRRLEKQYLGAVVGIGGASGAAAAVPGAGTVAAVATGAAEVTAFVSATAMYVLALAELHGVPVSDPDVRRLLVLSVLVGESGVAALEEVGGRGVSWAQVLARGGAKDKGATEKLAGLNGYLGQLLLRRFGTRQGALLVGRALPLGMGAVIGAGGNAALGRGAIATARKMFGSAPTVLPPRVVDG